jgi:tetratricopeptide (TPR) repeat protein
MVAFAPHIVVLENIGPWAGRHEFQLFPGINILQAANGRGKTIWLAALAALARGEGRLPLNDQAKKGRVEGFGGLITVGAATRHLQEFELDNLEGKLSLSQLVDPGLKTALAADRKRIEALVALTGTKAKLDTFANHRLFQNVSFSTIVGTKAAACTDLCEMAERIAKDYHKAARDQEELAKKFTSEAAGLEAANEGVELLGPCDDDALQAEYRAALQEQARVDEQLKVANEAARHRNDAQERMKEAKNSYAGPTVPEAEARRDTARINLDEAVTHRQNLEAALKAAKDREESMRRIFDEAGRVLVDANRVQQVIEACDDLIRQGAIAPPSVSAITAAADKVKATKEAVLTGQRIRQAKANVEAAAKRREDAQKHKEQAERMREAAKAVDQVLSESIQNPYLFVESVRVEKANETVYEARLMAKHPTRGSVPYDELSAGERWKIAIDLAADTVGEGGLIVIDQEGWEGIDVFERPKLQEHCLARQLIVATAEATRDVNDGTGHKLVQFGQMAAA